MSSSEAESKKGEPISDFGIEKNQSDKEREIDDGNVVEEKVEIVRMERGAYRMEVLKESMDNSRRGTLVRVVFAFCIFMCGFLYTLDSSVTGSMRPLATSSYQSHSQGLAMLQVATSIISCISQPIIAKVSDVLSRPIAYAIIISFYTLGYIIVASSTTLSAYVVGTAISAVGTSGINFMNTIIIGDLTSLKWRGLCHGIIASPSIWNTWYAPVIVTYFSERNWRWSYGMFAIMIPVILAPAIFIMFYFEKQAQTKLSAVQLKHYEDEMGFTKNWRKIFYRLLVEVDVFGLLLLGFGISLILLPFSLYETAGDGWRNPSLIAMLVVGGILVIGFIVYETLFSKFPSMPMRVLNRTLVCSIVIDFFYELGGYMPLLYNSSYVYIVTDWSVKYWTYYNNTLTVGLCFFGLVAGLLYRVTHRYKVWQIFGLSIRIVGTAIMLKGHGSTTNEVAIIFSPILIGMGGGFSVVGSTVALQASVPHKDMAIANSVLNIWTSIGSAIGSTIASVIWGSKMRDNLRHYMPSSVNSTAIDSYFADITVVKALPFGSEVRQGAINAYKDVNYYLTAPAVGLAFIALIAGLLQSNFRLGNEQNAVDQIEKTEEEAPKNWFQKVWYHILH